MKMDHRSEPIMISQLINQVSHSEWIRGKAYFRNGRIDSLKSTETTAGQRSIQAEIHAAETHVGHLLVDHLNDLLLDWQCSCPQDSSVPCRHLIAMLLQYMQDTSSQNIHRLLSTQSSIQTGSMDILQTEVHILFRYQKHTDLILVMPRLIKRNASGLKVMSSNPLDSTDVTVSSQVNDRMALRRDCAAERMVIDFFSQWKPYQHDLLGCLSFEASQELPLLVRHIIPALPEEWHILYDREFEKIIPRRKTIAIDFANLRPGASNLLAFDLHFQCDQLSIDPKQLEDYLVGQQKWLVVNGQFVEAANKKQLGLFLDLLIRLQDAPFDDGHFEVGPACLANLILSNEDGEADTIRFRETFDATFDQLRRGLQTRTSIPADEIPAHLDPVLRHYQRIGVQWLLFLERFRLGGILADDMGLGKTLQILSALTAKHRTKPSLIICPKTLLFNWQNEARRFAPTLKTVIVHGSRESRLRLLRQAGDFDLMITSYPLVLRDFSQFSAIEYEWCILDEAQMIKNPETHLARQVKKLKASQRYALTGTPMENSLIDLWSIFDFILPGYLGSKETFRIQYESSNQGKLLSKIQPFILRRTKSEVLTELPGKIEETIYAPLTQNQLALYQQTLMQIRKDVESAIHQQELAHSRMVILAGLTRLRQVSNHPGLIHDAYRTVHGISGKLELFDETLRNLLANGHRVLVFSQFTQMLAILAQRLQERCIEFCYLDGQTQDRVTVINRFNTDLNLSVFLISLKAGGFGLNLTTADTVILFDPWWNPMVENQAADRTHRFGQDKVVTVYRLISQGTIEEKIQTLQEQKQLAFDQIINQSGGVGSHLLSIEDLKLLLYHDHDAQVNHL